MPYNPEAVVDTATLAKQFASDLANLALANSGLELGGIVAAPVETFTARSVQPAQNLNQLTQQTLPRLSAETDEIIATSERCRLPYHQANDRKNHLRTVAAQLLYGDPRTVYHKTEDLDDALAIGLAYDADPAHMPRADIVRGSVIDPTRVEAARQEVIARRDATLRWLDTERSGDGALAIEVTADERAAALDAATDIISRVYAWSGELGQNAIGIVGNEGMDRLRSRVALLLLRQGMLPITIVTAEWGVTQYFRQRVESQRLRKVSMADTLAHTSVPHAAVGRREVVDPDRGGVGPRNVAAKRTVDPVADGLGNTFSRLVALQRVHAGSRTAFEVLGITPERMSIFMESSRNFAATMNRLGIMCGDRLNDAADAVRQLMGIRLDQVVAYALMKTGLSPADLAQYISEHYLNWFSPPTLGSAYVVQATPPTRQRTNARPLQPRQRLSEVAVQPSTTMGQARAFLADLRARFSAPLSSIWGSLQFNNHEPVAPRRAASKSVALPHRPLAAHRPDASRGMQYYRGRVPRRAFTPIGRANPQHPAAEQDGMWLN